MHWPAGIKAKGGITHQPAHLVDILPTLAEMAGAKSPDKFPGREPTPLAGTSLLPVFAGKALENRPPIHLMFGPNRGLRQGDWKLVSYRAKKWELYNLAEDRFELNDLAAEHPDIVEKLAKEWHRMAKEEVLATVAEQKPVLEEGPPHEHRERTKFDKPAPK